MAKDVETQPPAHIQAHNKARYQKQAAKPIKSDEGLSRGFLNGSGVTDVDSIIKSGGMATNDDTTIDLSNSDTKESLVKAKGWLVARKPEGLFNNDHDDEAKKRKVEEERVKFFNEFSAQLHTSDMAGAYYPEYSKWESKEAEILAKGRARILNSDESARVTQIASENIAERNKVFDSFTQKTDIQKSDIAVIETKDLNAENDILAIREKAAERALGYDDAKKAVGVANQEMKYAFDDLSVTEIKQRRVSRLEDAASEAKLTPEEAKELSDVRKAKDEAAKTKAKSESDFAKAKKDNNLDCTELANFSAVAMKQAGLSVHKVRGHVYNEGESYAGCHAYNVMTEKRGGKDYVVGVFEATAETESYKKVMKPITLSEFKSGNTLVTFSERTGWSTYGTGKYNGGRRGEDMDMSIILASDKIVATDTAIIAKQKIEYTRNLQPEMLTDKIKHMMDQYNISSDNHRGEVYLDLAKDHSNPRLATAMQMLDGLPPRDKADSAQLDVYAKVDKLMSNDDITDSKQLSRLAVTEQTIAEFEDSWPAVDVAKKIHKLAQVADIESLPPQLKAAAKILKDMPEYGESFNVQSKDGKYVALDAYRKVESIVMDNNTSAKEVEDLIEKASKKPEHELKSAGVGKTIDARGQNPDSNAPNYNPAVTSRGAAI